MSQKGNFPMPFDPDRHHRHSMRLPNYDYTQPGTYYLTLCTHQRACLFGEILDGVMNLNPFGTIVTEDWAHLPKHHPHLALDVFVVMPNHLHGILVLCEENTRSISDIMRGFKSFSARRINRLRQLNGVAVWQTAFYDHVVRDESDLARIREYIVNNPARWAEDVENQADGDG